MAPNRIRTALALFLGAVVITAASLGLLYFYVSSAAIPQSLRTPPAALASKIKGRAMGQAEQTSRAKAPWTKPFPPRLYEEYVEFQLQADPHYPGAALYLELRKESRGYDFAPAKIWPYYIETPLSALQKGWLGEHAAWLARLRKMIESGGPPMTREGDWKPHPDYGNAEADPMLFVLGAEMLSAQAQRLIEEGKPAEAAEIVVDAIKLARLPRSFATGKAPFALRIPRLETVLRTWIASGALPLVQAQTLLSVLGSGNRASIEIKKSVSIDYLTGRQYLIDFYDQSVWRATADFRPIGLQRDYYVPRRRTVDWLADEPVRCATALYYTAIGKARIERTLKNYDALHELIFQSLEGSFASIPFNRLEQGENAIQDPILPVRNSIWMIVKAYESETRENLIRAGLATIISSTSLAVVRAEPGSESAWRDPFADARLRVFGGENERMIYSIGPDLRDDRAATVYDPTNGSLSAGDLAIVVRRLGSKSAENR